MLKMNIHIYPEIQLNFLGADGMFYRFLYNRPSIIKLLPKRRRIGTIRR